MPRLHKAPDGHYYVRARFDLDRNRGEAGYSTWQITEEGLDFLHKQGISAKGAGNEFGLYTLRILSDKGWLTTQQTGVGRVAVDTAVGFSDDVFSALVHWAKHGRPGELMDVLHSVGIPLDKVFDSSFLQWLVSLEDNLCISDFVSCSLPDFRALSRHKPIRALPLFHTELSQFEGGLIVFWQFARLIGYVMSEMELRDQCPPAWADSIYGYLFNLLKSRAELSSAATKTRTRKRSRPRPYIWWDVDGQRVVAVLPSQRLGEDERLSWSIVDATTPHPDVRHTSEGTYVEETISEALVPQDLYEIRTKYTIEGAEHVNVEEFRLPSDFHPFVLFSEKGELVSADYGGICNSGDYLILVPPESSQDDLRRIEGLDLVEEIDYGPVGWWGWTGYRVRLAPGAGVAPYRVADAAPGVELKLSPIPSYPVDFLNALPVWFGSWPHLLLHVSDMSLLDGARLEMSAESAGDPVANMHRFCLGDGSGNSVPVRTEGDATILDLNMVSDLGHVFGAVALRLCLPAQPDLHLPLVRLIRAPVAGFSYVQDPFSASSAKAVAVETGEQVTVDASSELLEDGPRQVVRAMRPVECAEVGFGLGQSGVTLRVRTPVTRVKLISRDEPLGEWAEPPVALCLSETKVHQKLRVELHETPILLDDDLLCKIEGGPEVAAGAPCGLAETYDIELHRWRDQLGVRVNGTVAVRCKDGWIPLATLEGERVKGKEPTVVVRPQSGPDVLRHALVLDLEEAAVTGDTDKAACLLKKCIRRAASEDCPLPEREILLPHAARIYLFLGDHEAAKRVIGQFEAREDMPELRCLEASLQLRSEEGGVSQLRRFASEMKRMPSSPQRQRVLAEYAYRVARTGRVSSDCLRDCLAYLSEIRWAPLIEETEKMLLAGIADLLRGREPTVPEHIASQGQGAWLLCVRYAWQYLTTHLHKFRKSAPPSLKYPPPEIWHQKDTVYVSLIVHQASERVAEARRLLDEFNGYEEEAFPGLDLLRARQLRLEGKIDESKCCYRQVLQGDGQGQGLVFDELTTLEETN